MSQSQKERYDENNVKAAKIIDKILQTKFTDNTAEETQRNMLAQKSKIEKIEQISAIEKEIFPHFSILKNFISFTPI